MGLFGKVSKWAMTPTGEGGPSRLSLIGAGLQDAGNAINGMPTGYIAQLQDRMFERQQMMQDRGWQQEQRARQKSEWSRDDQKRSALKAWAETLPAGQLKSLAEYDPETAYEMYAKSQAKTPDWQVNKYNGQIYAPGADGSPMVGGRIPGWQGPPATGAQGPQLAPGEEWE